MKRTTVILLIILAAAAVAWLSSSPGDSTTVLLGAKPPKEYKKMSGVLTSVDARGRAVVVSNANLNRRFEVDPAAEILLNGEACALADLRRGNDASVFYSVEGKVKLAHRIVAQADAPRAHSRGKPQTRPAQDSSEP